MDQDEIRAEIRRLGPWHHDVEIAPGIRTGDPALAPPHDPALGQPSLVDPLRDMATLIADLYPNGLEGRSFLDCACNAGGHVFGARALGAGRALGFDARASWIEQARFLSRFLPSDDIAFEACTLADLPPGDPFDLTLFRGIFYHLPDPVAGLKLAADRTREVIVVNTAGKPGGPPGLVLNWESTTQVMSGVDGLAWLPTGPAVVAQILRYCGFPHTRVRFLWSDPGGWTRMEVIGARDAAAFAHYDAVRPETYSGAPLARRSLAKRILQRLRG